MKLWYLTSRYAMFDAIQAAFPDAPIVKSTCGEIYLACEPSFESVAMFDAIAAWIEANKKDYSLTAF